MTRIRWRLVILCGLLLVPVHGSAQSAVTGTHAALLQLVQCDARRAHRLRQLARPARTQRANLRIELECYTLGSFTGDVWSLRPSLF
jgi:hypothetical protein